MAKDKNEAIPLKKGKATFNLVGKAKVNDYTFDIDHKYDSGWTSNIMNIGVDCGDGNVVYAEMSGGYFPEEYKKDNKIYVHGVKQDENDKTVDDWDNTFTIDWDDRNDPSILETIGKGCFVTVGIEKDERATHSIRIFLQSMMPLSTSVNILQMKQLSMLRVILHMRLMAKRFIRRRR